MARDIVCDMAVDEETAADKHLISLFKGQTYYFCSEDCKRSFDAQPLRYTQEKPAQLYAGAPAMPLPKAQQSPPSQETDQQNLSP